MCTWHGPSILVDRRPGLHTSCAFVTKRQGQFASGNMSRSKTTRGGSEIQEFTLFYDGRAEEGCYEQWLMATSSFSCSNCMCRILDVSCLAPLTAQLRVSEKKDEKRKCSGVGAHGGCFQDLENCEIKFAQGM